MDQNCKDIVKELLFALTRANEVQQSHSIKTRPINTFQIVTDVTILVGKKVYW